MEGKFKFKYNNKEEYDFGVKHWTEIMAGWKDADTEFKRDFRLTTDDDNLEVIIKLNSTRDLDI